MFGLNDKDKQDETLAIQPSVVTKSNADLPDGLGRGLPADMPAPSLTPVPPIMAGPIDTSQPSAPMPPHNEPASPAPPQPTAPVPSGFSEDEMIKMKQQALQSLAPLVNHLDQTPEEKFRTTMMLLQASDNPELVKEAYSAANEITDEKARAQALLDVVNEINYFTQHKNGS
jgi:hypothetical protein